MNDIAQMISGMQAGDYVRAEFEELGRPYILEGELKEYTGYRVDEKGLSMPNGQSVRQTDGSPGGNLVRILNYAPKELT